MKLSEIINRIRHHFDVYSSEKFINGLREKGIIVGDGCIFQEGCKVDMTRPSLVTIGINCFFSTGFTLLTHDYATFLFKNVWNEFLPSSGCVTIGNNVYFGQKVTVLKGVSIGDNCVIGLGSIVTHSIPDNSVAVGTPAKVIGKTDEYFNKRKTECIKESFAYVKAFEKRNSRRPTLSDLWEEFPLFTDKHNISQKAEAIARKQLGGGYEKWLENHQALFDDIEDFLEAAEKYKLHD